MTKQIYLLGFLLLATSLIAKAEDELLLKEKIFDLPERDVAVIASELGYFPSTLSVFVGERVKLFFTTTTESSSCLILNDRSVSVGVTKGKVSESEFFFDKAGSYNFFCPTGNLKGRFLVLPRPGAKEAERNIASSVKVWVPKDE